MQTTRTASDALLAALAVTYVELVRLAPTGTATSLVTGVTVGLYLGWVSVATLANTAAVLTVADVGELGLGATTWSVIVIAVSAALSVAYSTYGRRRPSVVVPIGLAMAWGPMWIGLGRTDGPLLDQTVATAAFAAAVALLAPVVTTLAARRR